jgi:tRNA modification GTPase
LKALREQLITFSALIELELDFSTEDVEFADRGALLALIDDMLRIAGNLVESFKLGNVIKSGVSVAITGKPNAGKSTLLNTLLNENRAIVSEIAGTTRDTIEEALNIDGIIFRLIDTAGLRDSADVIEMLGVEKSREKMRLADLVVYLFDCNTETADQLQATLGVLAVEARRHVLVGNKADILGDEAAAKKFAGFEALYISAKANQQIEVLKQRLVSAVLSGQSQVEDTIITNARHHAALQAVVGSLTDVRQGLLGKVPGDLLALDIRRCLHFLGEITGTITHEDQLDYIFSKFCIGK